MTFTQTMLAELGPRVEVPPPIHAYFQWIDAQGLARSYRDGRRYALIDPALENSCLGVLPPDPGHASAWTGSDDPDVADRLKPFCRTGGDGSYAAFCIDDAGATQLVHLGSGSGSTMIGVMVNDPVDFLRLLAIGYVELCWPEQHGMTPAEIHEEEYPEEDYEGMEDERPAALAAPESLQVWLTDTFDVTIPERASDIIGELPDMDGTGRDDPFVKWLDTVQSSQT